MQILSSEQNPEECSDILRDKLARGDDRNIAAVEKRNLQPQHFF